MVRRSATLDDMNGQASPAPPGSMPSVSRVVAYNLRRARQLKGWTQDEAIAHLAPRLGKGWRLRTTLSTAENWRGERVRRFDPDELVAFSIVYQVPVSFFFIPPPPRESGMDLATTAILLDRATEQGEHIFNRLHELDDDTKGGGHQVVTEVLFAQEARVKAWEQRLNRGRRRDDALRDHLARTSGIAWVDDEAQSAARAEMAGD
jgi:transcriptional regulator with XRE-family HTH domain